MSLLSDAGKFFAQAVGGGAQGQLQTETAFSVEYSALRNKLNTGLGTALGKLGNFGLADALGVGAADARNAANAQESGLLASVGVSPAMIMGGIAVVIVGVLIWNK